MVSSKRVHAFDEFDINVGVYNENFLDFFMAPGDVPHGRNSMEMAHSLGADLRSLRRSRGLTLEALSGQLGRSVGWLSQVERDISQLDEKGLTAIAEALDVSVSLFAAPPIRSSDETGRIVRKNVRRDLGERVPGLVEELLSPDLTDSFEVIHSTFLPARNCLNR